MDVLRSMFLSYAEYIPEGALAGFIKLGEGWPVTLAQVIAILRNVPPLA
jgi:hypothetical protein